VGVGFSALKLERRRRKAKEKIPRTCPGAVGYHQYKFNILSSETIDRNLIGFLDFYFR
jgi:hypothetical protein